MDTVQNLRLPLILFATVGSALSAGVFFAFSTFVMWALALQLPASGIATMQAINITVFTPWFMAAFIGPAVACLLLIVSTVRPWQQPGAMYWLVGSVLYLVGSMGVTVAGNIPLNDALAVVAPGSAEGAKLWARYLTDWTFWNHVRTIASLGSAALLTRSLF